MMLSQGQSIAFNYIQKVFCHCFLSNYMLESILDGYIFIDLWNHKPFQKYSASTMYETVLQ